jgi:uncharacterized RDD family membrane protein YckC
MVYCTRCGRELSENSESCPSCKAYVGQETAAERILSESALQRHWVKRVIAILVDSIIVGLATGILGLLTDISRIFNWLSLPFVMGLMYVLYFTVIESLYGYTMGKKLVDLKVTAANGKKPDLKSAFIRNVSKIHFLILLLDTLGGFFMSKDAHQRYIDQIANTTVI